MVDGLSVPTFLASSLTIFACFIALFKFDFVSSNVFLSPFLYLGMCFCSSQTTCSAADLSLTDLNGFALQQKCKSSQNSKQGSDVIA